MDETGDLKQNIPDFGEVNIQLEQRLGVLEQKYLALIQKYSPHPNSRFEQFWPDMRASIRTLINGLKKTKHNDNQKLAEKYLDNLESYFKRLEEDDRLAATEISLSWEESGRGSPHCGDSQNYDDYLDSFFQE